jgi:hypothetical protein
MMKLLRRAYHFQEVAGNTVTTSNIGCKRKPTYARTQTCRLSKEFKTHEPGNTCLAGVQKLLFLHSANPPPPAEQVNQRSLTRKETYYER